MENRQRAFELWKESGGQKPLKDIATELGVPTSTVRNWKARDKWDGERTTSYCDATRRRASNANQKIVEEVGLAEGLTEFERNFCLHYIGCFNATQAAYKAGYQGTYAAVKNHAWTLLRKPQIQNLIKSLKQMKRLAIMADVDDMIELQMRIAFSDIGQYVEFGQRDVPVMGPFGPIFVKDDAGNKCSVMRTINYVDFKPGELLDTQLISEISQGRDGAKLKLADRGKALEFLSQYFLANPLDKHKIDYENRKLAIEEKKQNGDPSGLASSALQVQSIAELIRNPVPKREIEGFMPGGESDDPVRASDDEAD